MLNRRLPIIFLVSSDPSALQALQSDLEVRFGNDTRVIAACGPAAGLARQHEFARAGEPVALLIADQLMPDMTGIQFLASAHALHPRAKRILLVERDYTAANPIVPAMMLGQIDYHLTKPWLPDQGLYLAVSEFLASWARLEPDEFAMFRIAATDRADDAHAPPAHRAGLADRRPVEHAGTDQRLQLGALGNVSVDLGVELVDGEGDEQLLAVVARDRCSGANRRIPTAGLFVMIGAEPHTDWLEGIVARDEDGFILTGRDLGSMQRSPTLLETSVPGVFAAGDVRHGSIKRVTTAMGDGATVIDLVHDHLESLGCGSAG